MGFSMIQGVGKRLAEILAKQLVPDVILHPGSIGLCSPDDHGDYRLGIYLYDVNPSETVSQSGMVNTGVHSQTLPSTFLSLDYMITAYSDSDLKFRAEEEMKILGRVVQVLGDQRVLTPDMLGVGASMGAKIELQRLDQYEKMRLWTFPNEPYKLSLFYRIEPVEITSAKESSVVRVRDFHLTTGTDQRQVAHSFLVVLPVDDLTGRPVTGSNVRVSVKDGELWAGNGRPVRTPVVKGDGYRVFMGWPEGEVTLLFESGIYEETQVTIRPEELTEDEIVTVRLTPNASYPKPLTEE